MTHTKYKILRSTSLQGIEDDLNTLNERYNNSIEIVSPLTFMDRVAFFTIVVTYIPSAEDK